jgi:hypothetical protein
MDFVDLVEQGLREWSLEGRRWGQNTGMLRGVRCDAKFLTCEISDYCRTAHAQTMCMNDFGS